MAVTRGGTPKARALGAELREAREASGQSLRAVARELETNHVKLGRYESGAQVPAPEFVAVYLAACGTTASERDRVVEMARDADQPDWLTTGRNGSRHELTTLIEFERTAIAISDVATDLVPGLLQTSAYARALMLEMSDQERETRVLMRVGRREVLTDKGVAFTAIISERALSEPIGGHPVMAEQLRHIVDMSERPNVAVQVLRSGSTVAHPAHMGSFVLYNFPKASPIVHFEHYQSASFLHNPTTAQDYAEAVTTLQTLAMNEEESKKFIANQAEEMEAIDDGTPP
ncbi:Helix-turn-helix domain-containing protein [Actinopolyspora mzabensis]|uniref:Helix-turn-helix domain-containing protein n=1 Tax=Actinopolyspora mzabensis TaxID=995066 RepID=A0A1G8WRV8_ACTMZ|nr:helix-turn-helix transcriptional regulator [Actinopolyspora mzabensis]SDJ81132.1 Helix-turn-helix domain-containing protein [Actinopolyspora mzabensis]